MNTFGQIFRLSIFGESHGPMIGITVDGCPAGIPIDTNDFLKDLTRRQGGKHGTTPRKEADIPTIVSGVFNNISTGAPITLVFKNENIKSTDYSLFTKIPRPGHADFVMHKKFKGFNDYRGGGHSSGRLTVALVGAGVIAKKILNHIHITATVIEAGGTTNIDAALLQAFEQQDSIGGIVECIVNGLPVGLGEPFFNSVESLISHATFAIPAIKGIEFGAGFKAARMYGSSHNDSIANSKGTTLSNNAGGINGGVTNGNNICFRVAVKPTSSTPAQQTSWNKETNKVDSFKVEGRHDLCIALRVPVVLEAITAIVLTDLLFQKNNNK